MIVTRNWERVETGRTHVGLTVAVRERYAGDDLWSHEAVVMDPTVGRFRTIHYDGGYPEHLRNTATVDAPPEILAVWERLLEAERALDRAAYAEREATKAALALERGATLKVVKGRKVPIGTVGTCIWVGVGHWGTRVGLKDATGTAHWTAASNVVVDVDGDTAATLYDLHADWLTKKALVDALWAPTVPAALAAAA